MGRGPVAYASERDRKSAIGILAGLCIGGTVMTHVDAIIYLVPLPVLGAIGWIAARRRGDHRGLLLLYSSVALAAVPLAVLGTVDVQTRSTPDDDALSSEVHQLYAALGISALVSITLVAASDLLPRVRERLIARRREFGTGAAWVVGVTLAIAWVFRPLGPKAHWRPGLSVLHFVATLQKASGLPVQANRSYAEQTMRWLEWYMGPVALGLAIAGLCILVLRSIRSGSGGAAILLFELGGVTALYLWNPNVVPDQVWAARRFVTAAIPLFLICAGLAVDELSSTVGSLVRNPAWRRGIIPIAAAGIVAFPLSTTLPVANFRTGSSFLPTLEAACSKIGLAEPFCLRQPPLQARNLWKPFGVGAMCPRPR